MKIEICLDNKVWQNGKVVSFEYLFSVRDGSPHDPVAFGKILTDGKLVYSHNLFDKDYDKEVLSKFNKEFANVKK